MPEIVNKINTEYAYERVDKKYPCIFVENTGDAFPLLVTCLKTGDIPLALRQGENLFLSSIGLDPNPVNLALILKVYPITIYKSANEKYHVTNAEELLNLGVWWKGD